MNSELAYSRPVKTAEVLGDLAEDRHRFLAKNVLLTGESPILATPNGKNCFLDSLRLLVRICPNITVSLPEENDALLTQAKELANRIEFGNPILFEEVSPNFTAHDAILSVGTRSRRELPWTTINSNGWIVRVTSGGTDLPGNCEFSNPIGALGAASLGAGEVFKRLIRLRPERGEMLNGFAFSLRRYGRATDEFGEALPERFGSDLLIVGGGAIGNGLAHLIARLPFKGKVQIVDRQNYGDENLGTCILIGPADIPDAKAAVMEEYLKQHGVDAEGVVMPFEEFAIAVKKYPAIVLNGLDNIGVRHEVQRSLWPNVVIDGAIGDFTCQVSRHPWPDDVACLICLFREPAESAEDLQKEATGLSPKALAQPDRLLEEADVLDASVDKQEFLRARLGRPICSVVQEGIAEKISNDRQAAGFQPSVPFVATFSACMVMAEAVAHICGWPSVLEPRFQFDFLLGPTYGQLVPQGRRTACICKQKVKNINLIRRSRGLKDGGGISSEKGKPIEHLADSPPDLTVRDKS
jgi:molybdopterin/thiamine biosynthesis adenylyltransferase